MILDYKKLKKFEEELIRKEKVDIKKNFRIVEALYREAVELGVIPLKDPLDGLKTDIKIAKVVNSVSKAPLKNSPNIK
jgi:hypothetical protein